MICFPNCKINIGLSITGKRSDGFHTLESIFAPVDWCDVLEVVHNDQNNCSIEVFGEQVTMSPEENIVFKAHALLQKDFNIGGVNVQLLKHLPSGAGLGGGSSDGSFMLRSLNDLFDLKLTTQQLQAYAAQLGSDCPFFIENKSCFVTGRGEIFEPNSLDLSSYFVTIIHPGIHVNTGKAFSWITPKPAAFDLRSIGELDIFSWKKYVVNDFEAPVLEHFPAIASIKNALYEAGAIYASMSGSGSAVYGIFSEKIEASDIMKSAQITSGRGYTGKFLSPRI
jgi:4-diphosphocytidyl-2-C-methyl-D-erythritol kinase